MEMEGLFTVSIYFWSVPAKHPVYCIHDCLHHLFAESNSDNTILQVTKPPPPYYKSVFSLGLVGDGAGVWFWFGLGLGWGWGGNGVELSWGWSYCAYKFPHQAGIHPLNLISLV